MNYFRYKNKWIFNKLNKLIYLLDQKVKYLITNLEQNGRYLFINKVK